MSYFDEESEKIQKRLISRIRSEYTKAWADIKPVVDAYFASFKVRSEWLIDQLDEGKVPLPLGMSAETYFRKWLYNQVGRGERWNALQEEIRRRIVYADVHAAAYMNESSGAMFALSHNWTAYTIDKAATEFGLTDGSKADVAFNIVDENTVKRLVSERVDFLPQKVADEGRIETWCNRKTQSELLAAIMSGDSVDKLANRFQNVTAMSERSALLNARTAITNAQNAGRHQCAEEAEEMGLTVLKEWRSTLDDKTRDSHQQLDGERVPIDEPFSNGLMYPGDATGAPAEVYNCRCTYITIVEGLNDGRASRRARDADGGGIILENVTYTGRDDSDSYVDWLEGKAGNDG